jgi:hypothetical protein
MPTSSNLSRIKASRSKEEALQDLLTVVTDQVPVGTEDILKSPHVSEGPGRIANSPVPSVYNDDRGEIHRIRVGQRRMNILFSRTGVMRSGYLHPHDMYDFVVSGKVEVWTLNARGTEKKQYGPREFFKLDPYTPHVLHFLEDTITLEFWEGPFRCWYYHPYRRIVQLQNSLVEEKTHGLFQHLVPQDMIMSPRDDFGKTGKFLWWTTGLAMGVIVGSFVARRK